MDPEDPIRIPITGEIDLHTFNPREIESLLSDYLSECRQRNITRVRVIHGKGTGTLRATVERFCRNSSCVAGFHIADELSGSWGATIVTLRQDFQGPGSDKN